MLEVKRALGELWAGFGLEREALDLGQLARLFGVVYAAYCRADFTGEEPLGSFAALLCPPQGGESKEGDLSLPCASCTKRLLRYGGFFLFAGVLYWMRSTHCLGGGAAMQ